MNKLPLKSIVRLICLIGSLFLSSCQNSESTTTGNPVITMAVSGSSMAPTVALNSWWERWMFLVVPVARALPPPSSMVDKNANSVVMEHAWISLREIEFKAEEIAGADEVDGSEVKLEGPFDVDLFSATPAVLGSAAISNSQIRRIKFKLAKMDALSGGAPAEALHQSLLLSGTVNGHHFLFQSDDEVEFEVSGPNAVSITNGADLLLSFKIANLISNIDMSAISGDIVISQSHRVTVSGACPTVDASASSLYDCFRKGIEQQANLGKDEDGNGELGSGEESVD